MTGPNNKRILIVDDSILLLGIAKQSLEMAGFRVAIAQRTEEIENHLKSQQFDLILMDVQMPELFGDDIAGMLRAARDVRVPIYLFSNLDASELGERAERANVDGFICKRDGVEALVEQVRTIFARPRGGASA